MTTRDRIRTGLRTPIAFLVLFGAAGLAPSLAQEAAETRAEVTVGPQHYVDEERRHSAKFEEYRDVPNGFVAERLLFEWVPKPGFFFDVRGFDVSQRDQKIGVRFGKTDLWKGTLTWQENPRLWTDRAVMLYADQGGGLFTLEDTLQEAVRTAPASADTTPADGEWDAGTRGALIKSAILSGANDVFLGHQRRTGAAAFQLTPNRSWTLGLKAERELRSGTTPQSLGMTFSLAPSEVAAPLDFRTDTLTASAEYAHSRFTVGGSVAVSKFETGFKTLVWDNQLSEIESGSATSATPAQGRLTLGTDSDVVRMSLYGGVNLAGHTRLNATFSRATTTQDDPLLPMTINSLLAPTAVVPSTFDGEYNTTLADVRVSSRPARRFRWSGWARSFEYQNESPSVTFADYVTTDAQIPFCSNANACGATTNRLQRRNLPYGYERTNIGVLGGFKVTDWLDASLSYEIEGMQREHSAVEDSDEDILKLALDFDVADWLQVRTTARRQERRADEYNAHYFEESFPIGESIIAAFNEGTRRFYWTDRDRDAYSLLVDITPTEKFSIYAEAVYGDDTYLDPETGQKIGTSFTVMEDRNFDTVDETYTILLAGRTRDESTAYTLGFSLAPAERFNLYADYTWETSEYGLETRYRGVSGGIGTDDPLDDWGSDVEDRYDTASLGFEIRLSEKRGWSLRADASRSTGEGDIETHFTPGGQASGNTTLTEFPRLKTTLTLAQLALSHSVRKNLDYTVRYWYESWQEDNFASDFMQPYMGDPGSDPSMDRAIFLGIDFADYTNHILSFLVRYRFD
jgi:MtrB/PioB family decaheme-associated outer membrane protein